MDKKKEKKNEYCSESFEQSTYKYGTLCSNIYWLSFPYVKNNHRLLRMENIYGCNFDHDNYYHFVRKAAFSKLPDQAL